MSKAPAFPVYTKDFDTDEKVVLMNLAEEGAFGRLLRHQWREGSIPKDIESIAKILRVSVGKARKVWTRIAPCFKAHPELAERLINSKTERVRAEQSAFLDGRSAAGKKGAQARWRDRSANGKANAEPLASTWPAVAVAVAVAVPTTTDSRQVVEAPQHRPANPLVDVRALVSEGSALIRQIAALADLDPTEVLSKASAWRGRSYVRLDAMPDDRLAHTVNSLRSWARKLNGQAEPELPAVRAGPSPKAQQRVDVIRAGVMGGLTDYERRELEQGLHGAVGRLPGSGNDG